MKKKFKTIGIIGGMGPEATAELYLKIIRIFQQKFGSVYDEDFPEMIILNLPIPDVVENPSEEDKVKQMLIEAAQRLEGAGADFIAIPCNTIAYYQPKMEKAVSIPIVNILQETANEVKRLGLTTVGLIATEMTINKNIYRDILKNVKLLTPNKTEQKETTRIILNILSGKKNKEDKKLLEKLINKLKEEGAERVILGCTDLPLLIKGNDDTLDTLEILARVIVKRATEI